MSQYNEWYQTHAPAFWRESRRRAEAMAREVLLMTGNLRQLSPSVLERGGDTLTFLRNSTAPPLAKERAASLASVRKALVDRLHRGRGLPPGYDEAEVDALLSLISEMLDPGVFKWVREGREPTDAELAEATLVIADRSARTFFEPMLRKAQEVRQVKVLEERLAQLGYAKVNSGSGVDLPPRTYRLQVNVPYANQSGAYVNVSVDCVANPGGGRPIALIEMKSAGDYTNVNKRRKEEAAKAAAIVGEYGDRAVFLLQLFGYFNEGYFAYESSAGIDWAWDHRLEDLDIYLA